MSDEKQTAIIVFCVDDYEGDVMDNEVMRFRVDNMGGPEDLGLILGWSLNYVSNLKKDGRLTKPFLFTAAEEMVFRFEESKCRGAIEMIPNWVEFDEQDYVYLVNEGALYVKVDDEHFAKKNQVVLFRADGYNARLLVDLYTSEHDASIAHVKDKVMFDGDEDKFVAYCRKAQDLGEGEE